MKIDRRSFLRLLLASAAASTLDVEKLLWVPKPMIVVPGIPSGQNIGAVVAAAWEEYVGKCPEDRVFNHFWLLENLKGDPLQSR